VSGSRVIRAAGAGWEGVPPREYRLGGGAAYDVVRHTLLGGPGGPERLSFEVRYFEVAPGGSTSLERHAHPHAVLVIRGEGAVRLGDRAEPIGPLDVVYVAPDEVHRFDAGASGPLGFLCVVDRDRDRPVSVED
jgi:quercetin dioxygenase-like cupin family protein